MTSFVLQLLEWGSDIRGSKPWEFSASVAENTHTTALDISRNSFPAWDRGKWYKTASEETALAGVR